jgi:predicted pyridoxine 5'-phosphate oxidase superfamily flavin-nucleotide-binding protein
MQDRFETRKLADRVHDFIVAPQISDEHRGFIETRDLFFLTTIDHRGYPTVSHKGGPAGFVRVADSSTLAFPSYDGNGMFLSMGNISANDKVGMLFIDFETPHRIRVHGRATVAAGDPLLSDFPGAELVVRVAVTELWINCPRYIHRYQRIDTSPYVPGLGISPPPPQWKRIDGLQDVLPARDAGIAAASGGTITPETYAALVMKGEG